MIGHLMVLIIKMRVYSIPYNGDTRALFYNKDLFAAAGLDPEDPPSTIEELNEAAEKTDYHGWEYL